MNDTIIKEQEFLRKTKLSKTHKVVVTTGKVKIKHRRKDSRR